MEVLKARVVTAFRVTTFPKAIGLLKEMVSTDAVTTREFECRWAEMAATTSIQCISLPPIKLFKVLVSLGSTISVMVTSESLGVFGCVIYSMLSFFDYHPSSPSKGTKEKL